MTKQRCPASMTTAPEQYGGTCPVCGIRVGTTALGEIEVHMVESSGRYVGKHRHRVVATRS